MAPAVTRDYLKNRLGELKTRQPDLQTPMYAGGLWALEMMALQTAISEFLLRD